MKSDMPRGTEAGAPASTAPYIKQHCQFVEESTFDGQPVQLSV